MKPTSYHPASCAIAANDRNTLKRTTTYLECGTYWLQDLWKIVCTLKTEKTQKIMAYHVIMHCDMDISEKKIYQQHSSNRHSFQLWRSPKNTALHHGKDQVLAYPPQILWIYPSLTNIHRCKMKNNKKQDEKLWKKFTLFSPYNKRENNNESCPVLR